MIKLSKLLPFIRAWVRITIFTWIIYMIVWLCMMFINWEYINPFSWIIDIPNESSTYRAKILFSCGAISFFKYMAITVGLDFNKSKR